MSKEGSKCFAASTGREERTFPACSVFSESSRLSIEASDTHACIDRGPKNIGADCAAPGCFVAVQTDKQAELLYRAHASTRPERTSQAQPANAACRVLVRASSESGCATSGNDSASEPPRLHRQNPERLMSGRSVERSRRCRELLMDSSRHILTGLASHPDSTLISFSLLIFPPSPLRLLCNVMP